MGTSVLRLERVVQEFAPGHDLAKTSFARGVRVTLKDGTVVSARVDHPAGDIEAGVENDDLAAKFARMTGPQFAEGARSMADQILEADPPLSPSEIVGASRTGGLSIATGARRSW